MPETYREIAIVKDTQRLELEQLGYVLVKIVAGDIFIMGRNAH